jgi:hypothetical protein
MRVALMLLVLALCSCEPKDQARTSVNDPLDEARHLAEEGKYQEALEKHVWLHDHVLESRPAYYGVRLSYALDDWVELGKKYPKALETLKNIRDKKTSRLLAGENDRDLFIDVEAINAHVGESNATVRLFKQIEASHPDFAASIYEVAEEDLVGAQEYALARKYLGEPLTRFAQARQNFDHGMQFANTHSKNRDASRQAFENIFSEKVVRIITVLDKAGDRDQARAIQTNALAVLDIPQIRNAISR